MPTMATNGQGEVRWRCGIATGSVLEVVVPVGGVVPGRVALLDLLERPRGLRLGVVGPEPVLVGAAVCAFDRVVVEAVPVRHGGQHSRGPMRRDGTGVPCPLPCLCGRAGRATASSYVGQPGCGAEEGPGSTGR